MGYVTINGKRNTDWGMDYLGRLVAPASAKVRQIEIPLRDGVIDITETVDGVVRYKNRQIAIRCEIRLPRIEWSHLQMELANEYHGKIVKVSFDDDGDHYWIGRCNVSQIRDNGSTATIEFVIDAEPFRRQQNAFKTQTLTVGANTFEDVSVDLVGHSRGFIEIVDADGWSNIEVKINNVTFPIYKGVEQSTLMPVLSKDNVVVFNNPYSTSQTFTYKIYGGDL